MMRRVTLVHDDNAESEMWVNTDHVVTVRPRGDDQRCWITTTHGTFALSGNARDVALELNGYFDE